jgi:hypothetical protein
MRQILPRGKVKIVSVKKGELVTALILLLAFPASLASNW